jgi:acetyltransferase-like isoleucine patch superfamily enzyme/coenzyme F420-reducing hydrogenase beta subunit
MLQLERKEDCCGCNACGDICPCKAITFKNDNEGFWYPEIDKKRCIDCELCERVCPIIHIDELKKNDLPQSICYAAEHKNIEVIFDSTSGGLFSALAEVMYRKKGYVGGAIFNDDLSVSQFVSDQKDDLPRLRSSKYLQSNAEGFYKRIKELLMEEKDVLVCGTPCQMAGLRAYLGKDYPNLIIVDFICRGINSPKIWQKYMQSFADRYGSKVVFAKAKSKEYGWRNLTQKVRLEDGREFFETGSMSNFTRGYLRTNAYCRPSCYECHFKGFPRIADITLADFWGIEKYDQSMEKNLGTSLVMVNSQKGQEYFELVKKKIHAIQMPFETILAGNPALIKPLHPPLVNREKFFADVDKMNFTELAEKYILHPRISTKQKVKNLLKKVLDTARFAKYVVYVTRLHPKAIYQTIRYSGLINLLHKRGILFSTHCTTNISRNARLEFHGLMTFGEKARFPSSSLESRLCIDSNGSLRVLGDVTLGYGCDIEIFHDAELIMHGKKILDVSGANIGCTIICGEKIEIGPDVEIGRNVTIRDNNGGHYINRQGYKNTRPVRIGEKAWLCESCTLMSGARIGVGAVVGAKSFVVGRVPDHSMVLGYPAKVIDENIQWKY